MLISLTFLTFNWNLGEGFLRTASV